MFHSSVPYASGTTFSVIFLFSLYSFYFDFMVHGKFYKKYLGNSRNLGLLVVEFVNSGFHFLFHNWSFPVSYRPLHRDYGNTIWSQTQLKSIWFFFQLSVSPNFFKCIRLITLFSSSRNFSLGFFVDLKLPSISWIIILEFYQTHVRP